jgi:threonine dehydratase
MWTAIEKGEPVTLKTIDRFVDGAAVKRVGDF